MSEAQRIQNEMNALGEIYRLKGELLELRDERDRLAELVGKAQPHVCSLLCPSVKVRHELWTHTKLCLSMQAALTPAGQRWTRERPTEPGWYWYRAVPDSELIVWVNDAGEVSSLNYDTTVDRMPGEWQGPLFPSEARAGSI